MSLTSLLYMVCIWSVLLCTGQVKSNGWILCVCNIRVAGTVTHNCTFLIQISIKSTVSISYIFIWWHNDILVLLDVNFLFILMRKKSAAVGSISSCLVKAGSLLDWSVNVHSVWQLRPGAKFWLQLINFYFPLLNVTSSSSDRTGFLIRMNKKKKTLVLNSVRPLLTNAVAKHRAVGSTVALNEIWVHPKGCI